MEYRWYAIQTTAGHEKKVRNLVAKRIEEDPRPEDERLVRQALVPVQDVVEIKAGKRVTVERKLYPGYVLVEMGMTQEALHVVNSVQGVIKFVGTGRLPQPLRQEEVNRLLGIGNPVENGFPIQVDAGMPVPIVIAKVAALRMVKSLERFKFLLVEERFSGPDRIVAEMGVGPVGSGA